MFRRPVGDHRLSQALINVGVAKQNALWHLHTVGGRVPLVRAARLRRRVSVVAAGLLGGLLLPGCWLSEAAPVPPNTAVFEDNLTAITCPSTGFCIAVGTYTPEEPYNSLGYPQPFTDILSDDSWTASVPPLPSNTDGGYATLTSVSCSSAGACVAVGEYPVSNVGFQPLIETLANGTWTALQAPLPSDASTSQQTAQLTDVSCASDGTCAAVGSYTFPGAELPGPFIETFLNDAWSASVPPVPSGDTDVNGIGNVSCASASTCIISVDNFYEALSSGQWEAADFPVPTAMQSVSIGPVTCLQSGFCLATGNYDSDDEQQTGSVFETYSDGTWTASLAPVPSDARDPTENTLFLGMPTCVSANSCVTVGEYETTSEAWQTFSELDSSGSWTIADIPVPSDASLTSGNGPQPTGLSCSSGPTCTVIGTYKMTSSAYPFAFSSTLSGGTWTLSELNWPVASYDLVGTSLFGVSCPSSLVCQTVGGYATTSGWIPTINTEFNLSLASVGL